jgi:hypothetical protein
MRVGSGCSEIQIARSNDLELYRGGCSIDCSVGAPCWTGLESYSTGKVDKYADRKISMYGTLN